MPIMANNVRLALLPTMPFVPSGRIAGGARAVFASYRKRLSDHSGALYYPQFESPQPRAELPSR
jgi:hypothetical protein